MDLQQTSSCILSAMATKPIPVYIQDKNSRLVMECQFDNPYQVVIDNKQQGNLVANLERFTLPCTIIDTQGNQCVISQ